MLAGHRDRVTALVALPGGRLASGSWDRTIRLWTVQRGAGSRPAMVLGPHIGLLTSLVALPDGHLASGDDLLVRLWQPPPLTPEP